MRINITTLGKSVSRKIESDIDDIEAGELDTEVIEEPENSESENAESDLERDAENCDEEERSQEIKQEDKPEKRENTKQKSTREKKKITSTKRKVFATVITDVLLVGVGLVVFALFHHALPQVGKPIVQETPIALSTPTPKPTNIPIVSMLPEIESDTQFFFDGVFLTGDNIEKTETTYKSKNISVELSYHVVDGLRYYVQDIYVRKMTYFKTAFADGTYGRGITEFPINIAKENEAVCAISGDYYGARGKSAVIRNGVLYRDSTYNDICVIYNDGVMKVMRENEFDGKTEMEKGAYQAWDFGPNLMDENGKALTKFNSRISGENPRTAIGYYEPGHYCFVVVDGRGANGSDGLTLKGLAALFEEMGCKAAYNLDGGRTSCMVMYDTMINDHQGTTCRQSSDIIMVTDFE